LFGAIEMKFYLRGELQHMAESEMRDILDEAAMAQIRFHDPNPTIKVYKIAHVGTAGGRIVGLGKQAIQYFEDSIKKIVDRLPLATKAFDGHGKDSNSHAGREPVGQVVGKTLKEIGGKLHAIAAMYIKPAARGRKLDCASIETNLTFEPLADGIRLVDLDEITGIALGDSNLVSPGFSGATMIGAFQAFEEKLPKKGGSTMTREEMQAAIREGGLKPSDLFDSDSLFRDGIVGKLLQTEVIKGQDLTKKLGDARSQNEALAAEKDATIARLKAEVLKVQHLPMFESLAIERKLEPRQKAFLDQRFGAFKTDADNEEGAKAALGTWVSAGLVEYDNIAKIFVGDGGNGNGKQQGAGMGAPAGDAPVIDASNQADPAVNRLIPGGAAAKAAGL
jgi:hypothetical protein